MKLAFYKATAPGATWIDREINRRTGRLGFSHVELVFADGVSFSSSGRDGGCRFKTLDIADPATWEVVGIGGTPEQETAARNFCLKQDGKKYDWLGVIGFVFTDARRYDQPGYRWFCSEVCVAALQASGLWNKSANALIDPMKESPNALYRLVKALGLEKPQ